MLMSVKVNFIENIFRSRLTLVSSNDIITIKIKKLTNVKKNKKKGSVRGKKVNERSDRMICKTIICKDFLFKEYFETIIFP